VNRRYLFIGIALAVIVSFAAFAFWGTGDWNGHNEVTRVVPGQNGETLIIQEGGNRGFFPFFPFFLIFPLFWIFVIGGLFRFFGWRRWGGGPGYGPGPETREAWLADWHQRQHSSTESAPAPAQSPPEPKIPEDRS
jgi:hypothetical protein